MIKAILLDLFGTVVGYGDVVSGTDLAWRGIYAVLARLGLSTPYESFAPDWERQLVEPLAPEEDTEQTPFLGKMLRLLRRCSLPQDRAAAAEAASACLRGWDTHLYLPEDTLPTLRALRPHYRLALVSNFDHPPYVRELLQRLKLETCFDVVIISGDVRIDKPDPRIYHMALDALGCAAQESVFVGDSLSTDIAGALAVGCRPVLMDLRDRHPSYPGERIRALGELVGRLDGDVAL